MRGFEFAVELDPEADTPLFAQIARAIGEDVRRGRLRPGAALPGSRTLAQTLRVHRNTVLAAYRELQAEGWIETRPAGGTFVSRALAESPARAQRAGLRAQVPARPGYELGPPPEINLPALYPRGTLALSDGLPDLRLIPTTLLARAYRRALRRHGREALGYGPPQGTLRLREALSQLLPSARGVAASPDTLQLTRGSTHGLDLVARALVQPGDVVAVEAWGYRPSWSALRAAGARLQPIPVDADGIQVAALEQLAQRVKVRAVYLTPHHQYPTMVLLSPGRRMRLLDLARRHRIAVLEDDYDHDFHYDGRPVLPLAAADSAGVVIYIGTMSKILAPGVRIGFVVAPQPLVERLARVRMWNDRQGDQAVELAVAELVEDGEMLRHLRKIRRVYQARRAAFIDSLRRRLGDVLQFDVPPGGVALWARAEDGVDVDAWAARGREVGVAFHIARKFAFDGKPRPFVRLCFSAHAEAELDEAVRRMAAALPRRRAG